MKLLLTSAGITNPTIHAALLQLLGKPIEESAALAIPTSNYGRANGPERAWVFATGREPRTPMVELGWKSVGLLEITALPSIGEDRWIEWVQESDVLLVNGGDALYLAHHMRLSGFDRLLPKLRPVYVGLSAASMALTPRIGEDFINWRQPSGGDETLGIVDFSIFPHLDNPGLPENTMTDAERWATTINVPSYAIDDSTAITVVDGAVEVVSEGHWKRFEPA